MMHVRPEDYEKMVRQIEKMTEANRDLLSALTFVKTIIKDAPEIDGKLYGEIGKVKYAVFLKADIEVIEQAMVKGIQ